MGGGKSKVKIQAVTAVSHPTSSQNEASGTWATRTKVTDRPGSPADPSKSQSGNSRGGWSTGGEVGARMANERVVLLDADEDDEEVEIICEGKNKRTEVAEVGYANAQEAPQASDSDPDAQAKLSVAQSRKKQDEEISTRQKEEAAKLAEQRRKFDNQRYQRELAAEEALCPKDPGFSGFESLPKQQQRRDEPPRLDLMMGLNLSVGAAGPQGDPLEGCLPGGIIGDTPRLEQNSHQPALKNNKHDEFEFNDDDEMLMKEILDSVDT
mmetsp:Transcript_50913/g.146260  ORF Transcript_50913/g.146260 Transcript_50913/m.146260 type:complete len:267 (-) Transcript_50913:245-1045(-)